eukprot:Rhum_TRINITY_DN12284_c0_g2::Rhum_TRINITY_DN12284_c0_g2_i1::g.50674::m.50674
MELCNTITTCVGRLCLERPVRGQVFGAAALQVLGRRVFSADHERPGAMNVLREDVMRDARRSFERVTWQAESPLGGGVGDVTPLLVQQFTTLKEQLEGAVKRLKSVRHKLQAMAITYLCVFYVASEAGTEKRRGVAALVSCFEGLMRDDKVMKNLQQHLRSKVFLTDNQTELCSCFFDLHLEVVYCSAILMVHAATELGRPHTATPDSTRASLRYLCDSFITHVKTLESEYEPVALMSICKRRHACPSLKPPQHRVETLRAAFTYVKKMASFTSGSTKFCIQ